MNGVERKQLALVTGRQILAAIVELIDAELDKIDADPATVKAPKDLQRGRSGCQYAVPPSAMKCPMCGVGVYRARSDRDERGNKRAIRICDDCGYRAGSDPKVHTKAHRLALLVRIGEAAKARHAAEMVDE